MPESSTMRIDTICPHCQAHNKTTIYPTVNSESNPKITKRIIDDTFFDKKCSSCGETYFLDYTAMFKDEESQCIVCYVADDEGESYMVDTFDSHAETLEDDEVMCVSRIVRDRNSFREKVRIFSMGFDDRVIELFKVWGLEHLRSAGIDAQIEQILCWVCDDGVLELSFFGQGENAYSLNISFEQYEEAEEQLFDFFDTIGEDGYYIDLDWAIRIIAENDL